MGTIGVVIPSKNRAGTIERALKSVLAQKINAIITEIVIVDDGSDDNTYLIIEDYVKKDKRIKYIKNKISVGGAKARNQGAEQLTSKYIAFLDSDDQWKRDHLKKSLEIIESSNSEGVFGSYTISDGKLSKDRIIPTLPSSMNIAEYIFSDTGDIRTSTIVMNLDSFNQIKFDSNQQKHQDWDLAIRFSNKFKLSINKSPTVILHEDVDNRMSKSMKHEATLYFINKHKGIVSDIHLSKFYFSMCRDTLKLEGKNQHFYNYRKLIITHLKKNETNHKYLLVKFLSLYLPRRVFVFISKKRLNA